MACTRKADGSIRELIGQIADVSELVKKTTYLEAISRAGVIGLWDLDVGSNQMSWDAQMYRLYGLTQPQTNSTYQLWEQAGRPEGRDMELWLQAEEQCCRTEDNPSCQG